MLCVIVAFVVLSLPLPLSAVAIAGVFEVARTRPGLRLRQPGGTRPGEEEEPEPRDVPHRGHDTARGVGREGLLRGRHPGGAYAFSIDANRAISDGTSRKAFRGVMRKSKWKVLRGYHAFRHSFASNLAAAGVDQRVIDELMGHTTVEMQKRYRHLFPD